MALTRSYPVKPYDPPVGNVSCLLRVIALILAVFWAAAPAHASNGGKMAVCIAPMPAAAQLDQRMADPAGFDCLGKQPSHGSGDFLVRLKFAPVTATVDDPLVLRLSSIWQDRARIHFRYADGSQATLDYSARDTARFLTIGAIVELPVPQRAATLNAIFVEAHGSGNMRGVVLGPELLTRSQSVALRLKMTILYSAFAGLALALIVYNLSMWAALRHRFQLLYCAMVAALGAYTFTSSGMLTILLPWIENNDRLRINYVLLGLAAVTALMFVRSFFETRVIGPALQRAFPVVLTAAMAVSLAFALLAPWRIQQLDLAYSAGLTAVLALLIPVLFNAWRSRSRYFWLFLLAWTAPIAMSFTRALHGFNLIEYSFWLDNGNLVALSIEGLLSALMINVRLRELGSQRDKALAGEQMARRMAATDPLTGLLNRRAFLDLAIGRKSRQRLLLIDIDRFKEVNDRLGHVGGDDVLRGIAEAIQSCRPQRSLAVRLGGEEFGLLIPRSAAEACTPEQLLDAVRHHPMPQGVKVTVSLGYADGSVASEEDWQRLYRVSDAALFRAKSDGRDRACRATDFRAAA